MSEPEFEENSDSYGLVMPFVVVESNGGPFNDDAYVNGCEFGYIQAYLEFVEPGVVERYVHTPNVPQLDLLAMEKGYTFTSEPWDEHPDDWTWVRFHKPCAGCQDTKWTEDENWSALDCGDGGCDPNRERIPHDGLIPCGFCNHGGWDAPWPSEVPDGR